MLRKQRAKLTQDLIEKVRASQASISDCSQLFNLSTRTIRMIRSRGRDRVPGFDVSLKKVDPMFDKEVSRLYYRISSTGSVTLVQESRPIGYKGERLKGWTPAEAFEAWNAIMDAMQGIKPGSTMERWR